jgi:hypothetical protein
MGKNLQRQETEMVFEGFNVSVMSMHTVRLVLESHWRNDAEGRLKPFHFVDPASMKLLPRAQEPTIKLKFVSSEEDENLEVFVHFKTDEKD